MSFLASQMSKFVADLDLNMMSVYGMITVVSKVLLLNHQFFLTLIPQMSLPRSCLFMLRLRI